MKYNGKELIEITPDDWDGILCKSCVDAAI